jgi:hypothetical protein
VRGDGVRFEDVVADRGLYGRVNTKSQVWCHAAL